LKYSQAFASPAHSAKQAFQSLLTRINPSSIEFAFRKQIQSRFSLNKAARARRPVPFAGMGAFVPMGQGKKV